LNFGRRGFGHDPFLQNRGFHRDRFNRFDHHRFDHHRFDHDRDRFRFGFRNCFGFNCGWGWPWWWGWDPGWGWDSDSSYDQNQGRDLERANEMNLQSLEEQRRQEDADSNVRSDPQPQPREDVQTDPPAPSTVLVFRDQHRQEIQNYAISGTTLLAFSPHRTQRISLADVDIPATTKANDNRGLDFRVPGDKAQ
jgi:hypothetical protein